MWISKRRWEWILSDLDSLKSSYSRLRDEVCGCEPEYSYRILPGLQGRVQALEHHLMLSSEPDRVPGTSTYWVAVKLSPPKKEAPSDRRA